MKLILVSAAVMDLTNQSYQALQRYFNRLSQAGYVKYGYVEYLLAFLYIQEILQEFDLDQDEQLIVSKAVNCLWGSNCLIPYTSCKEACV